MIEAQLNPKTTRGNKSLDYDLRRRCARFVVALLAMIATGCTTMGGLEPPDVTLVTLDVKDITLFETTLDVTLRLTTPNLEPLQIEGASFKLYLEGRKFGSGLSPDTIEVPRLATALMPATFHISNASALLRLRRIIEQNSVNYGLHAKLYVTRPNGRATVRIQGEGTLDLPDSLQELSVDPPPELGLGKHVFME